MEALAAVIRRLCTSRLRSSLTVASIATGTAVLVVVTSLVSTIQSALVAGMQILGVGLLMVSADPDVLYSGQVPKALTLSDAAAVRQSLRPDGFAAIGRIMGSVQACDALRTVTIHGTGAEHQVLEQFRTEAGRFVTEYDGATRARVCVLGAALARSLRCVGVGSQIQVSGRYFRVVGILADHGTKVGESTDGVVMIPIETAQRMYRAEQFPVSLLARVSADETASATHRIRSLLRRRHRLKAEMKDDFAIVSYTDAMKRVDTVANDARTVLVALVGVSLVVAAIGVLNSLFASVFERTSEIGLHRCVGATRGRVRLEYMLEGLLLSLLGSVSGVLLGTLVAVGVAAQLDLSLQIAWDSVALGAMISVLLGVASAVAPAVRASELSPVDALRQE